MVTNYTQQLRFTSHSIYRLPFSVVLTTVKQRPRPQPVCMSHILPSTHLTWILFNSICTSMPILSKLSLPYSIANQILLRISICVMDATCPCDCILPDSITLCAMLISHGVGYEDCRLSGCDAVYSVLCYKYLDNTYCWGSMASETSAHVYQTTWRYILQDSDLQYEGSCILFSMLWKTKDILKKRICYWKSFEH